VDLATEEDLMTLLEAECGHGKAVLASTHDLAGVVRHFQRVICLNRTIVADGPARLLEDAEVLRATFGGHLVEVRGGAALLVDDPHHAAETPARGERRRA
jgi:ABC-type Mn2+/Zn2+ transport system ATPase subunit